MQPDASVCLVQVSEDQMYPFELDYYYLQSAGQYVDVYVLDSGLDPYLSSLYPGRFVSGDTFTTNEKYPQVRIESFLLPSGRFCNRLAARMHDLFQIKPRSKEYRRLTLTGLQRARHSCRWLSWQCGLRCLQILQCYLCEDLRQNWSM